MELPHGNIVKDIAVGLLAGAIVLTVLTTLAVAEGIADHFGWR